MYCLQKYKVFEVQLFVCLIDMNIWDQIKPNYSKKQISLSLFTYQKVIIIQVQNGNVVKFIYSEKATKSCEIFTLLLTDTT